jgi:putative transcription factor
MEDDGWQTVKSKPQRKFDGPSRSDKSDGGSKSLSHQDFSPAVLKKPGPSANAPRTVVKKFGGGKNSHGPIVNVKKLEEDTELHPAAVSIPRDISIQVQQARAAKKLTQKELASVLQIQESVVKTIENGTAPYVSQTKIDLQRIARHLGIVIARH